MQGHIEDTKRIAKNTVLLYGRMLFGMVVSLYTSRVVLDTLGVVDYGIYGVVGGFVTMFSLFSNSLSAAVSRFLTFELGKGDKERLSNAFSTSLLIHIVLAIVVFIFTETIGVWFVNNKMTISADRMIAANWVLQASVISFMFGLFSVPYNASIVSHEKMSAFAYIGILDIILRLIVVLFVAHSSWIFDKLIVYAVLIVAVSILLQCIYLFYCRKHFAECRIRVHFDKDFWKDISSFAGWNFIGCTAGILKEQGVDILLNLFVGPVLNAARSIAVSVNRAVSGFVGNFMTALNPQITKSYAVGDLQYAHFLVERGSRFSFYILLFFALPVLFETEFLLEVWLKKYPDHTLNFVRLVLILSLVDSLSYTLMTLQNATGNIRNYQLVVGGILLLNFPLSYLCLKFELQPESTYVIAIIVAILCLIARLLFLRQSAKLPFGLFVRNVLLNVVLVAVVASVFPYCMHRLFPYGWGRLLIVGFTSVLSTAMSIMFIGCNKSERSFMIKKTLSVIYKSDNDKDFK